MCGVVGIADMSGSNGEIFLENGDELLFKAEMDGDSEEDKPNGKWKIMIVDDELEVHSVTKMVLSDFIYNNKSLEFINAYTGAEAKQLIFDNPDTSIILLDVVMEEDDSGLKLIKYIREELKNKFVRIILRTGQSGQAPEEKVIIDYDISDYKEKMELTARKLFTAIITSIRTYVDIVELDKTYKKIEKSRDIAVKWNKILEKTVAKRTFAVRNLLNNAGQGFLSFGEDMVIGDEYSLECINIFECDIKNKKYPELFYSNDTNEMSLLQSILKSIFTEKDYFKQESYLNLISDETIINNKHIYVHYKLINDIHKKNPRQVMAILTDVTEKRNLESKFKNENSVLKMIVSAVKYYSEIMDCIRDYESFCETVPYEIINGSKTPDEIFSELFMKVHTFKGSFDQWHMEGIVEKLHNLEIDISKLKNDMPETNINDFQSFFENVNMLQWLEEDLRVLKDNLGDDFLNRESLITIDKKKLLEIEDKINLLLPANEGRVLLEELRWLRYKPFKELLKTYPEYVMQLAGRLEKQVKQVCIEGGSFLTDNDKYQNFVRSLVHIFRNMVDHGLEAPEERIQNGKDEYGSITCHIKLLNDKIHMLFSDDGRGIDINEIRVKAVHDKLLSSEASLKLSDGEVINILFVDGFSLSESISKVSGRGVGLFTVKTEVDRIGGKIKIRTIHGKGTTFYIVVPCDISIKK